MPLEMTFVSSRLSFYLRLYFSLLYYFTTTTVFYCYSGYCYSTCERFFSYRYNFTHLFSIQVSNNNTHVLNIQDECHIKPNLQIYGFSQKIFCISSISNRNKINAVTIASNYIFQHCRFIVLEKLFSKYLVLLKISSWTYLSIHQAFIIFCISFLQIFIFFSLVVFS